MRWQRPLRDWRVGERMFTLGRRTWIVAVLNLTPDSFYEASRVAAPAELVARAGQALEAGADVLDLGAESTRPGAEPVEAGPEQQRLLPGLEAVRRAFPRALVSVDTRHAATARCALDAGCDIVNDVTGLEDAGMAALIAARGCGAILMHHRGAFRTMQQLPPLANPVGLVREGLSRILAQAWEAGIAPAQVMLDPGFGFGKNLDENFPLLARLDELHGLGAPLLAGLSRKSFLRRDPASPPGERLAASLAAATAAVLAGAHCLRVHDVAATAEAVRVADRVLAAAGA